MATPIEAFDRAYLDMKEGFFHSEIVEIDEKRWILVVEPFHVSLKPYPGLSQKVEEEKEQT